MEIYRGEFLLLPDLSNDFNESKYQHLTEMPLSYHWIRQILLTNATQLEMSLKQITKANLTVLNFLYEYIYVIN